MKLARLGLAAVAATALAVVPVGVAVADPPGNNGTVKIDGLDFDTAPDNQPHVGCVFQVDWYGFDAGVGNANVLFELQEPTVKGRTMSVFGDLNPDIGEDSNAGGGSEAGLDHEETYFLSFTGAPHPQQGYHVKLTVQNPGSIGADVKHKVFWVTGCDYPTDPY
jgi:hypothetical protein